MVMDVNLYHEHLDRWILEEKKNVTFKWLSQQLQVHCDVAKKMLFSYSQKKGEKVKIIYLLSGTSKINKENEIRLISNQHLEECKKEYSDILSIHVYSVQYSLPKDSVELWTSESENYLESLKGKREELLEHTFSSIHFEGCKKRDPKSTFNIQHAASVGFNNLEATKEKDRKIVPSALPASILPNASTASTAGTVKSKTMDNFFGKAVSKSGEKESSKNVSPNKKKTEKQKTSVKESIISPPLAKVKPEPGDQNEVTSPSKRMLARKQSQSSPKKAVIEDEDFVTPVKMTVNKRRRQVLDSPPDLEPSSSSQSSVDEEMEEAENSEMEQASQQSQDEEVSEATQEKKPRKKKQKIVKPPQNNTLDRIFSSPPKIAPIHNDTPPPLLNHPYTDVDGKMKIKKLVKKTVTKIGVDSKGYQVTKDEEVEEIIEEDYHPLPVQNTTAQLQTKPKSPPKQSGTKQQKSIASFFMKK